MRRTLMIAAVFVLLAGVQLFVFTEQTDRFFAWTVGIPLTAAFLGASYWSAAVLEFLASRESFWAHVRATVPALWLFTTLTLIATLLHLDIFRTESFWAWAWFAVYGIVPIALGAILLLQLRTTGDDPPRTARLPRWLVLVAALQGVVLSFVGVGLFLAPGRFDSLWSWPLTPLTGRAIGAWLIGYSLLMAQTIWENDQRRSRAQMSASAAWALLLLVALARYADTPNWDSPTAWGFLLFIVSILVVGACGALLSWRGRQTPAEIEAMPRQAAF
jgi:hypothetical protein